MSAYAHWPEARVLRLVRLGSSHHPTGVTRHYRDKQLLPPPAELQIARHDTVWKGSPRAEFYLFYLDEAGNEMTDTYHETLEEAMVQAEREFQVKPDEWEIVG